MRTPEDIKGFVEEAIVGHKLSDEFYRKLATECEPYDQIQINAYRNKALIHRHVVDQLNHVLNFITSEQKNENN